MFHKTFPTRLTNLCNVGQKKIFLQKPASPLRAINSVKQQQKQNSCNDRLKEKRKIASYRFSLSGSNCCLKFTSEAWSCEYN